MVKLRAARAFNYAGRDLVAGEAFEATEGDALVLTRAAPPFAELAAVDDPQPSLPDVAEQQQPRRYNRRDMRAKA